MRNVTCTPKCTFSDITVKITLNFGWITIGSEVQWWFLLPLQRVCC